MLPSLSNQNNSVPLATPQQMRLYAIRTSRPLFKRGLLNYSSATYCWVANLSLG
jgi:hypothetical protein